MFFGYTLAQLRKGVIATLAALVTLGSQFGVVGLEDISGDVVAVFDAVAAVLVIWVPNAE